MTDKRRANGLDSDSEAIIFEGAFLTQIAKLFKMERRDVKQKIHGVAPIGKRSGYDIFDIAEVAPHLVKPIYDVETYLRRMHPNDLPKHLTKEFWAGQKAKQEYLKAEGDLWDTGEIFQRVGEMVKVIRMEMLLAREAIARETHFTPKQQERLQQIIDGSLNAMADKLAEIFGDRINETADGQNQDEEL